jgi:hypothetical protein
LARRVRYQRYLHTSVDARIGVRMPAGHPVGLMTPVVRW